MSWREDFEADAIWAAADSVAELLTAYYGPGNPNNVDPHLVASNSNVERLRDLVARIMAQRADPDITVTPRSLGAVSRNLIEIRDTLPDISNAAFKPFRNGTVQNRSRFDQIAEEVRTWPQSSRGKIAGSSARLSQLESSTATFLSELRQQLNSLEDRASTVQDQLQKGPASQAKEVSRILRQAEGQIIEIRREIEQLTNSGQKQAARIDEAIRAHQVTFTEREQERAKEALDAANRRSVEWEESLAHTQRAVDEHLSAMKDYQDQSRNVLAAVGIDATATHYGSHAKAERRSANIWRFIAVVILALAGLWFVASSILPSLHGDGALWEQAVSRLGITAAVAGVGLYAARESSQHRVQEREARRVELVLTALDPFIVNLDPERAQSIRDEAARALFVAESSGETPESNPAEYLALINDIVQRIPATARSTDSGQGPR